MSNFLLNRFRYVMVLLVAVMLLGLAGCNLSFEHDPEKTVTVEISGISEESDRDRVREELEKITQGAMHMMTSSSSEDEMTAQVSPVTDVKKFVQGINFGKVTDVSNSLNELIP